MHRLTRGLFITAGLSLVSLVLYLGSLYWREPRNVFDLWPLRLATYLGLISLAGASLAGAIVFWKKPDWELKIERTIEQQLERAWLREGLLYLGGLIVLVCGIPLITWIIGRDRRFEAPFLRYFWLLFLLIALVILAIFIIAPKPRRRRWLASVFLSVLFFSLGLAIQTTLLARLTTAAFTTTRSVAFLNQCIWVMIIWPLCFRLVTLPRSEQLLWMMVLIMTFGVWIIAWAMLPRKLSHLQPVLAFYTPIIIFGAPLLAGSLMFGWNFLLRVTQRKIDWIAKGVTLGALVVLAFFYYQGALKHAQTVNISTTFSDQNAYISIIKTARERNFHYTGDQNRMPGYPFLQAFFYKPQMSDTQLFEQGKRLNIILSLALMIFLFLIFLRYLSFFQATLLLLIVSFSLYVFKAPYIQTEISFYFISFLSFVLMIQMIIKPGWLLALATGFVAGLGYLTKGTILPSVLLFVGIFSIKELADFVKMARSKDQASLHQSARHFGDLALVMMVFIVVIFPYISQMKQRFGSYFYNVNTAVYIWYDEMEQAYQGEARYHFADGVPTDLPVDQIPSLQKYIREHTFQQAFNRLANGMYGVLRMIGWQFSVLNYQMAYAWIFLLALLADYKNSLRTAKKYPYVIAFTVLFFLGYLTAFAWYNPIASGRRFVYGLYIPFLFSVFAAINTLSRQQTLFAPDGKATLCVRRFFTISNLTIAFLLFYDIWVVLTASLFFDRYGS